MVRQKYFTCEKTIELSMNITLPMKGFKYRRLNYKKVS